MASVISKILAQKEQQELEQVKKAFENLKDGEFKKTSETDGRYNCIAYAANEKHRYWWPVKYGMAANDVYWPEGVSKVCVLKNFVLAFETLGYKTCDSSDLKEDVEKVAIYVTAKASAKALKGAPLHMARQLPSGEWTSKLGVGIDISHKTVKSLEGEIYGIVKQFMERPIKEEQVKQKGKKAVSAEFENFKNLARNLVNVPKKEVDEIKEKAEKKKQSK